MVNELTDTMPDELNLITFLNTNPESGDKVCTILLCYHGAIEEGERIIRPLREFGPPLLDGVRPMPYTEAQKLAVAPAGRNNYLKSHFMSQVSDDVVDIALDYFDRIPRRSRPSCSSISATPPGRVPVNDTAFGHRGALCEWATNAVFLTRGSRRFTSGGSGIWPRHCRPSHRGLHKPGRHRGRGRGGRDTGRLLGHFQRLAS